MVVYVIRNGRTGQEYVGTTVQSMRTRWKEHIAFQKRGKRGPLYDAMQRDGVEQFTIECIAECESYEAMLDRERAEIEARGTLMPHGYNVVRGGRGNFGWRMPEETRRKIAAKATGRVAWNRGMAMSDEQRAKLSEVRKGKPKTPAQMAAIRRGQPLSEEHRAKLRAAKKGYRWTDRHRAAMTGKMTKSPQARALVAEAKRAWWAAMTPDQRGAHIERMKAGLSARMA